MEQLKVISDKNKWVCNRDEIPEDEINLKNPMQPEIDFEQLYKDSQKEIEELKNQLTSLQNNKPKKVKNKAVEKIIIDDDIDIEELEWELELCNKYNQYKQLN